MQCNWRAFALVAGILLAGCSSSSNSSSGPDCTKFTACGGNVVGNWKFTRACFGNVPNPLAVSCPSATFQVSEMVAGTVEFRANGTYSSNTTSSSVMADLTLPASCLQGRTCAQIQSNANQGGDGGASAAVTTCTDAGGGCACQITNMAAGGATNGVYSLSGTMITIDGQPSAYCVQGNGLLIQNAGAMMAAAGTSITVAATKQ